MKKNFIAALFGVLFAFSLFGLCELGCSVLGIDLRPAYVSIVNEQDELARSLRMKESDYKLLPLSARRNMQYNGLLYPDQEFMFRVKPNPTKQKLMGYDGINEFGFRSGDMNYTEDKKRVVLVGNSCLFGWNLPEIDQTLDFQLQQCLNTKASQAFKLYNLSQPGYSSTQALKMYKKWAPKLKPDLVVIYMGWNDLWETPLLTDKESLKLLSASQGLISKLIAQSRFAAYLSQLVKRSNQKSRSFATGNRPRVPNDESVANFGEIASSAPSLIILPPFANLTRLQPMLAFRDQISSKLDGIAGFISVANMEPSSPDSQRYFQDDGFHANAAGNELIAHEICTHISESVNSGN